MAVAADDATRTSNPCPLAYTSCRQPCALMILRRERNVFGPYIFSIRFALTEDEIIDGTITTRDGFLLVNP